MVNDDARRPAGGGADRYQSQSEFESIRSRDELYIPIDRSNRRVQFSIGTHATSSREWAARCLLVLPAAKLKVSLDSALLSTDSQRPSPFIHPWCGQPARRTQHRPPKPTPSVPFSTVCWTLFNPWISTPMAIERCRPPSATRVADDKAARERAVDGGWRRTNNAFPVPPWPPDNTFPFIFSDPYTPSNQNRYVTQGAVMPPKKGNKRAGKPRPTLLAKGINSLSHAQVGQTNNGTMVMCDGGRRRAGGRGRPHKLWPSAGRQCEPSLGIHRLERGLGGCGFRWLMDGSGGPHSRPPSPTKPSLRPPTGRRPLPIRVNTNKYIDRMLTIPDINSSPPTTKTDGQEERAVPLVRQGRQEGCPRRRGRGQGAPLLPRGRRARAPQERPHDPQGASPFHSIVLSYRGCNDWSIGLQ